MSEHETTETPAEPERDSRDVVIPSSFEIDTVVSTRMKWVPMRTEIPDAYFEYTKNERTDQLPQLSSIFEAWHPESGIHGFVYFRIRKGWYAHFDTMTVHGMRPVEEDRGDLRFPTREAAQRSVEDYVAKYLRQIVTGDHTTHQHL